MIKVYGVKGLMEWQCVINCGAAKFHIHFKDGNLSGYGVTPAVFKTSDVMLQGVIETSDYFKRGKIVLVRTYGEPPVKEEVELETKEFASLDDARDYLANEYGVAKVRIRSLAQVVEFGKEKGINVVIE